MPTDLSYLAPDFNASKLTKLQLRSILSEHGVTDLPPASAKKEVLLELFEVHVRQKASQIKRAAKAVKPSAQGITMLDNESQPSSPNRRGSPMLASSASAATVVVTPSSSPRKQRSVSPPKRLSSPSPKARGRSKAKAEPLRVSEATPTTPALVAVKKGHKTSRSRSRSVVPETPPAVPLNPLSALQSALPAYVDSPKTATLKLRNRLGFIADANRMTYAQEAMATGPIEVRSIRSTGAKPKRWSVFGLAKAVFLLFMPLLKLIVALILAVLLGVYLRWKYVYPLPYCSPADAARPFYPEVDLFTSLKTLCLPCPPHGSCAKGTLLCEDGYLRTKSWLWLGERCLPDHHRFSKVEALVARIKRTLREQQGLFQCGRVPSANMDEPSLKAALKSVHRAPWQGPDFEAYYRLALLDMAKDPESHGIRVFGPEGERIFSSRIAILTWRCQLYLASSAFLRTYRWHMMGLIFALATIAYFYLTIRRYIWERRKADELVQSVLQILAEQDALNRRDPTRPATISVHQLRDALFMNAQKAEKLRLWPRVCEAIAHNSNVRESVMSIKGEQHRVWEWIGIDVLAPLIKSPVLGSNPTQQGQGSLYPQL